MARRSYGKLHYYAIYRPYGIGEKSRADQLMQFATAEERDKVVEVINGCHYRRKAQAIMAKDAKVEGFPIWRLYDISGDPWGQWMRDETTAHVNYVILGREIECWKDCISDE